MYSKSYPEPSSLSDEELSQKYQSLFNEVYKEIELERETGYEINSGNYELLEAYGAEAKKRGLIEVCTSEFIYELS